MVQFSTDPGTDVFVRGIDAGERARKARSQMAVDAAIRRGLAQSFGPDAAAAPPLAPQLVQAAPQAPARNEGLEQPPPAAAAPTLTPRPAMPQAAPAPAPSPTLAPQPQPTARPAAGDRYDPVLRELAGAEGGGAAALGIMQQQDRAGAVDARRRDQLARLSMLALSKGDVTTGQYFADQAGIPLPQIVPGRGRGGGRAGGGVDAAQARLLGTASLAAKRLYGGDMAQAQRFTQAYIQNGGDIGKAIEAAGDPSGGPVRRWMWRHNPQTQQEELVGLRPDGSQLPMTDDEGKPFLRAPAAGRVVRSGDGYASVGRDGTAATVTGQGGAPIPGPAQPQGGARAGGRPLDREVKRQMLVSAGIPEQEAALIAAGALPSPAALGQIRARISSAVNADLMLRSKPQAQKNAEIDRQYQDVLRAISPTRGAPALAPTPPAALPPAQAAASPTPAPQAAPPPAPAPAAARPAPAGGVPPRPANVPPGSQYSPSRRQWRTPDGLMLGEDGRPSA